MKWKCNVCNFLWEGAAPPEKCPKCGAPAEQYAQLSDEALKTVERSRFTNALHVELLDTLPRLVDLANEGIEDNLDPRCLALFERLRDEALFLIASAKAELEGHMKKGKWG